MATRVHAKSPPPMQAKAKPNQQHSLTSRFNKSATPTAEKLPHGVAEPMQAQFGLDFSKVRIFRNDINVATAGASALTQGEHIRFAPGQFRPDHTRGLGLIGHELTHVAQQRLGTGNSGEIRHDPLAEQEADDAARRVRQGLPVTVERAAFGIQPRMGFEFQGSNTIEYGYQLASSSPRWEPASRKSAVFHGRAGKPHVKLEPDSRGDFEFVTHPYASIAGLLAEVTEAHHLTRHIMHWTRLSDESNYVRLAQRRHRTPTGEQQRIHRGAHWSTMRQINRDKEGAPADAVRIHIQDPTFSANPQFTEGVRLEQIEGFFADNLGTAEPATQRAGAIQSHVNSAVGATPAEQAQFQALPELQRAQVRGFLSILVALFLYARNYQPGNPVIKAAFSVLHRTRVSAIYASLSANARSFLQAHAFGDGSALLQTLGTSRGERIFLRGYDTHQSVRRRGADVRERRGQTGPTVGDWFDSIVRPQRRVVVDDGERRTLITDEMSPVRFGSPSMGSLGMDEAPDGSESLVVLEVRNWGNRIMQINRTALQRAYDEDQARLADDPDALQLVPWSPGDPVGNSIRATLWRRWAERILVEAIQGNRGGNFTR